MEWYLYIENQQSGPFDSSSIKQMIAEKKINSTTFIWDNSSQNWIEILQIQEFSNLFSENEDSPSASAEDYYCYKNNIQYGPFAKDDLQKKINSGEFLLTDFCFGPGFSDWLPISSTEFSKTVSTGVAASEPVNTGAPATNKISFPCKNHTSKESFLICPICGSDFCEDCLTKHNEKFYCKDCFEANKESIEAADKSKKKNPFSFLTNLLQKKKK